MIALRLFFISLPRVIATGLVAAIGSMRKLFGIPVRRVVIHVAGRLDGEGFQFCELCECEMSCPGLTPWPVGSLIEYESFGCATRWQPLIAKENWVVYQSCRESSGIMAFATKAALDDAAERIATGR